MDNKEDKMLIAQAEDRRDRCEDQYMVTYTAFLDTRQKALLEPIFRQDRVKNVFYGGFEDAERSILLFLPDHMEEETLLAEDNPLSLLRVTAPKGSRKLTHRDYLGSILSLGIDRSVTGDIIVRDDGADILILSEMADFLAANYEKAGHTSLKAEILPVSELDTGSVTIEEKRDTVASLRLDNIVSSAFGLSRTRAQEAIRGGIVFVNNLMELRNDRMIAEGDKIVLRGRGKVVLRDAGGRSKKDRICIVLERYI